MEYIDGVKVTDVKTLRGEGIDPRAVGETVSNLFSLMVFSLGLTHCDPHPGKSERERSFFCQIFYLPWFVSLACFFVFLLLIF